MILILNQYHSQVAGKCVLYKARLMIRRTLFLRSKSVLRCRQRQLIIELCDQDETHSVPLEDIGMVLLEHPAITLTHRALDALLQHNAAVVTCNSSFLPSGMLLPLEAHSSLTQRIRAQIKAGKALVKRLWQQTVKKKIANQAAVLRQFGRPWRHLHRMIGEVRSGDPENVEAQAASAYWSELFHDLEGFVRLRNGPPPNHMLNYAYAVLRACVARSITGSGLLPAVGLHHRNKYNAFCLADDLMEPYRPFVDRAVRLFSLQRGEFPDFLDTEHKKYLIEILQHDVQMDNVKRPLYVATQHTAASLARCFEGLDGEIKYPSLP